MKKFCAMIGMGIKTKFAYRGGALLKIAVSAFSVLILTLFWKALYPEDVEMQKYMIRYAALSQILSIIYNVESKLADDIRTGNIVISLLKPWNYLFVMLQENIGRMMGDLFLVGLPVFFICFLAIGFENINWANLLYFGISVLLAFLIMYLVRILVELSCFWVIEAWSLVFLADVLIRILSGSFIPSFLMPAWMQAVMEALPFIWIFEMPLRILLESNEITNVNILSVFLLQLVWIIFLGILVGIVWSRGRKKLAVQGG